MRQRVQLKGQYHDLTAIRFSHVRNGNSYWLFGCTCGRVVAKAAGDVLRGNTSSCGRKGCRKVRYRWT
jgi:hypothetical protein